MTEPQTPYQTIERLLIYDREGIEAGKVVTTDRMNGPDFMHFDSYRQAWIDGTVGDEVIYSKYLLTSANPLYGLSRAVAQIRAAGAVRKHLKNN